AALELELLVGPGGRAGAQRDLLDAFRVLDLFGVLGIPLEVLVGQSRSSGRTTSASTVMELATALPHVRGVYWEAWEEGPGARLPDCSIKAYESELREQILLLRRQYLS